MHDTGIAHKQLDSKAVYLSKDLSKQSAFMKIGRLGEAGTLEHEEEESNLGYLDKYDEEGEGLFFIGSGAFGSAHVVRRKKDGFLFCAKKIVINMDAK